MGQESAARGFAADLARARTLAASGDTDAALILARSLMDDEDGALSPAQRAEAMLCVATFNLRLQGRFAPALEHAQRAALAFQGVEDIGGECRALATHAVAATRLGHHERAIESALLAVRLSEALPAGIEQVGALHAMGIAAHSARSFSHARNAYQQAIQAAHRCVPPLNPFELYVDLASTEALRYFDERNGGGARLSLEPLERHVGHCRRLLVDGADDISLAPMSHANNLLILAHAHTLLLAWQGRLDAARELLAGLQADCERLRRPWLMAAAQWATAELALAEGRLDAAGASADQVVTVAELYGHEGLLAIGLQLTSHVRERRGDPAGALRALREMIRREQQVRAASVDSRAEAIEWQLALRRNRARLQGLEADKRLLERLAMEDALTGLANRRRFESVLADSLGGTPLAPPRLSLALVDVDRFKRINDDHSHAVGDEVLKGIARAIAAQLREGDLAARLGGDEFAVLLRETGPGEAQRIAERMRGAVAATDWSTLATGLRVGISVGLAQAEPGDRPAQLLDRADALMYAHKRAAAAADGGAAGQDL